MMRADSPSHRMGERRAVESLMKAIANRDGSERNENDACRPLKGKFRPEWSAQKDRRQTKIDAEMAKARQRRAFYYILPTT
jgi:hypothetical protein